MDWYEWHCSILLLFPIFLGLIVAVALQAVWPGERGLYCLYFHVPVERWSLLGKRSVQNFTLFLLLLFFVSAIFELVIRVLFQSTVHFF